MREEHVNQWTIGTQAHVEARVSPLIAGHLVVVWVLMA